jgi:hypothetical protein
MTQTNDEMRDRCDIVEYLRECPLGCAESQPMRRELGIPHKDFAQALWTLEARGMIVDRGNVIALAK